MTEEMSFQVTLANCQGLSIPDGGGKFIPPVRNGEWKHSGKWFCASLWWRCSLADLRLLEGMQEGAEPVADLYASISVLNLMRAATASQCKEIKRGVIWALLGSLKTSRTAAFWIVCKGLMVHDGSPSKMALLCSVDVRIALLKLCFYQLFNVFLLSLFTRITSAIFIYDKRTLLDIGHRYTNLLQDTLSMDPTWPLEILRNTEVNKGRLNNPRRRKKHRGKRAGIATDWGKELTVLLYRVFCSLMSNPWRIRWMILEPG